jgi:seryl-tRNA synthetase
VQEEEKAAEKAVNDALLKLGNIVHDSVKVDNNEARRRSAGRCRLAPHALTRFPPAQDNNPVERTWGTPREETGLPNHVDLVAMLDIVDLEKGQEVAGSRGYYLKGAVRGSSDCWMGASLPRILADVSYAGASLPRPSRRACC